MKKRVKRLLVIACVALFTATIWMQSNAQGLGGGFEDGSCNWAPGAVCSDPNNGDIWLHRRWVT